MKELKEKERNVGLETFLFNTIGFHYIDLQYIVN